MWYNICTSIFFPDHISRGIKNKRAPLLLCSNDKLWWDSGHRPSWLSSSVVRSVTKEMRTWGEIQITKMTNFTQLCTKNGKIPQWHPTASTGFQQQKGLTPAAFNSLCKAVSNMIPSSWSTLFCLGWNGISILKFYKWSHSMQVPIGFLGTDSSRKREVSSNRTAMAHWRPWPPGADYKKD